MEGGWKKGVEDAPVCLGRRKERIKRGETRADRTDGGWMEKIGGAWKEGRCGSE